MEQGVREIDLRHCCPTVAERVGIVPGLRSSAGKSPTTFVVSRRLARHSLFPLVSSLDLVFARPFLRRFQHRHLG